MEERQFKLNNVVYSLFLNDNCLIMHEDSLQDLILANTPIKEEYTKVLTDILQSLKNEAILNADLILKINNASYFDINLVYFILAKISLRLAGSYLDMLKKNVDSIEIYLWNFLLDKALDGDSDDADFSLAFFSNY